MESSTILFLHGSPLGGWMWREVINHLPDDYTSLTPDLHDREAFSIDDTVNKLFSLIEDKAPVHIVGISVGGLVGLELLRQHPDYVSSALLSSPSLGPFPAGNLMTALSSPMAWLTRQSFAVNATIKQLGLSESMQSDFKRDITNLSGKLFKHVNQSIHAYRPENMSYDIEKPVMLICADKEPSFVKKNQQRLQRALGIEQVLVVPHLGHGWCFENPQLFAETIQAWINQDTLPMQLQTL